MIGNTYSHNIRNFFLYHRTCLDFSGPDAWETSVFNLQHDFANIVPECYLKYFDGKPGTCIVFCIIRISSKGVKSERFRVKLCRHDSFDRTVTTFYADNNCDVCFVGWEGVIFALTKDTFHLHMLPP